MSGIRVGLVSLFVAFVFTVQNGIAQTANPNNPNDFQYVFLAGGVEHSVALRCNGTVVTWGDNEFGQLGDNNATTDSDLPVTVVSETGTDSLINIIAVAAGGRHTLALSYDGTLWAWGDNGSGQLGIGSAVLQRNIPTKVVGIGGIDTLRNVAAIAAGGDHSLAILSDGSVVSWGLNNSGQLADSTKTSRLFPVMTYGLDSGTYAIDIAAGDCHSLVLQNDGRLKSCGCDNAGQLGDNGNSSQSGVTTLISVNINQSGTIPLTGVTGIAAGQFHGLAIDSSGTAWSWGSQANGTDANELGRDCKTPDCKYAGQIPGISNAAALVAGFNLSFALLRDSTIMVWGDNTRGELGLGDFAFRDVPTLNTNFGEKIVALSGGGAHGVALMESDSLSSWGWNSSGQLGNGNYGVNSNVPVRVKDYLIGVVDADAGPDQYYCSGDSVQIGGESPGDYVNYRYEWFPSLGLTAPGTTRPDTLADPWSKLETKSTITIPYILRKMYRLNTVEVCINQDTALITVYSGTKAGISSSIPPGCVDKPVNFYNAGTSAAGVQYRWNFGAGADVDTSSLENPPPVTYSFAGTKHIKLKVFDPFCGTSDSLIKLVPINDTPTVAFTHPAILCDGGMVDFTNTSTTGTGITYAWDFGSGSSPSTSTSYSPQGVVYSTPGTKTITLTVSNGNCTVSQTSSLTVETTPTSAFTGNSPSCQGDTIGFSNNSTSALTYQWSFDVNGTTASPATSTLTTPGAVVYSTAGLKTVQLIATNGNCSDTSRQTIQVNEKPTSSFTHNAPNCGNLATNFTNTGSTGTTWTYSWDFGSTATPSTSTAENPTGITYSSSGSKTVTFTVSSAQCSEVSSQTITINTTPTANFTTTAPSCEQDSVSFTNTGSTGGTWTYNWNFGSGASPATSTQENPIGIQYTGAGTKQIKLIITDGTCTDSSTMPITIHEKPTSSFTHNAPNCGNLATNFTNTGSTGTTWTYSWDFGSTATPSTSTAENPTGITYSSSGSKTVTFTVSSAQCSESSSQTITINATPTANFTTTAPSCEEDSVSFTNTGSTGGAWTYNWNFGSGASPTTSTQENPIGIQYTGAGTKQIKLIITDGTCTDSSTMPITIHDRPDVSFITSSVPVCAYQGVNFANSGSSASKWAYSWDFGQNAIPATASSENATGIIYTTGGSKMITLTISDQNCTETYNDTISIHDLPMVNAGNDTTICANREVVLGSQAVSGYLYQWFPSSTLDDAGLAQPTASPEASLTNYIVTVTDSNTSCENTDSILITMLDPILANAGIDVEICFGDSVQIGAALIEGQTYKWIPVEGISDDTLPNPIVSPVTTTVYTLIAEAAGCDSVTDQVSVVVHPLPEAYAGEDQVIALGSTIQLQATGGVMFEWSPTSTLSNSTISNPVASPQESTTYTVIVTDVYNCEESDSVTITVREPELWAPNGFTPNNDGLNDKFYIRGLISGIRNFEFRIYDEWGSMLFFTSDINDGWDGTKIGDGSKVPNGSYVYKVDGLNSKGEIVNLTGMVNLIR